MLTDAAIKRLRATDKDRVVSDTHGLYVKVYTSGAKKFMVRRMVAGKTSWATIGSYPDMSLAEARAKTTTPTASSISVQDAKDEWLGHVRKTYKSPDQVVWRMSKYVVPELLSTKLRLVTREMLSSKLSGVSNNNGPVIANRVLGDIKQFMSYCVQRGWLDDSPAALLSRKIVGGKEKSRDRVLTDDELAHLIRLLRDPGRIQSKTRYAMAIALLTGQRSGEVRGFTKSQLTSKAWVVPPQITKNGITSRVVRTPLLNAIFESVVKQHGSAPFDGMDGQTLARVPARLKLGWTPHDLRRTMATHMAEMGVMPHIVEKCLNHKMGGVMEIYNRADYLDEKRAAWRLWHRKLLRLRKKAPSEGG